MSDSSLQLANGSVLPSVGLGLWKIEKQLATQTVQQAVAAGYRHLDSACDYGNETEVGEGISRVLSSGLVKREDLWVTSKLWNTYHKPEHVKPALQRSLSDLKLDYLDLYLIHFPIAQRYVPFEDRYPPEWLYDPTSPNPQMEFERVSISDTWQAMEQLVQEGLVRHIGICNFGTALLRDLLATAKIAPAVLQIESHPYLTQEKLIRFCQQSDIAVTAFSPLGAQSYYSLNMAEEGESVLTESTVLEIAKQHQRTPAQVVLRWGIQRGTAVIPKTTREDRLQENIALFDFELSSEEMSAISALNRNRRFNDPGVFCEAAFNTFCPIYE